MAENIQVASLTAPITVKVPTKQLQAFQKHLEEIADTLEFIISQLQDMGKAVKKSMGGMGKSLKVQNITQNKFIDGQKQVNEQGKKTEKGAKRTAKVFGFWSDKIAQVRVGLGLISFALGGIAKLLIVPVGFLTAFGLLAGKINATTTEMMLLSKATGFAFNDMRALETEAKSLGFTFEHVNSLVEELNNKLGGEAGGFVELNLQEGLSSLRLEAEALQKLKPEKQLARIMDAGAAMLKKGNLQETASAFDKIFGQEGNRMLTAFAQKMNAVGMSYDEVLKKNKAISAISKEAQAGAVRFTGFFQTMTTSIDTVTREFFGKFGSKLAPFLDGLQPVFENLKDTIMDSLGGPVLDQIVTGFQNAIIMIVGIFDDLRKNPEEVKKSVDILINSLQAMFRIGMGFAKMLADVIPLVEKLVNFFNSDSGRYLVGIAAQLVVATIAAGTFFAILSKIVLAVNAVMLLAGSTGGLMALFGGASVAGLAALAAPMLAFGAAIAGVVLGTRAIIDNLGVVKDLLKGNTFQVLDQYLRPELYSDPDGENNPEAQTHLFNRLRNLRKLGKSGEADQLAASITKSGHNFGEGPNTSESVTNIVNNVVVNDPETGKEVVEFVNGKP